MNDIRCVVEQTFLVAESPRWHEDEQALYWVDIYKPSIERLDPTTGARRTWPMPERIGCFSFCRDGRVIAGMQSGIAFVDLTDGGVIETMDQRCNALYRYDADGTCRQVVDGLICANGLAFSPDGNILYHSDSRQDYVWAWDLDRNTGNIANRRVFVANDIMEGRPDGAAVDAEGYYWICCVGAWRVARFAPDGTIDRVVGVPVQRPTACTFGGPDLKTLYITSATFPLSDAALAKQPLAGSILAVDVDVAGLPESRFGI
jgi:sugar lactone lactonase YvrE